MRLGNAPDAAARARRAIAKLRGDLGPPLVQTLALLTTELVENSVQHTKSRFVTLRIAIGTSTVLTEVVDDGPSIGVESIRECGSNRTGWGLFLIQRLADEWGITQHHRSKRVWFKLRRP